MLKKNVWDHGRWALVEDVKFDFMTKYVFEYLSKIVSFKNKQTLELGSGLGRLSFLALENKPAKVTLVDSSIKALSISKSLFSNTASRLYDIVDSDLFDYSPNKKYDIVFSSGLIEHFQHKQRFEIIKKHIELASQDCIIIHPTDTLYARWFNVFPLAIKLYGFQKSFSEKEINRYLESIPDIKTYTHKRFHTFYTIPLLHNFEKLNRLIDKTSFGINYAGQTITHIQVK
jgi:cyclopropane fatty-acyl-phospholipid synthase-like methyltransferase